MKVIADSGATKTDWIILNGPEPIRFVTTGLSPFFNTAQTYSTALQGGWPKHLNINDITDVYFYGSGCAAEERGRDVEGYLASFFVGARVHAYSDALGAARALFGEGSGVVVILGTGCNVTYYDGRRLVPQTPSLGYALGDEGSGAYIGRLLLRKYLYHSLPADIAALLEDEHNVDLSTVLNSIYSGNKPSAYLASFVPFVVKHRSHNAVIQIVDEAMADLYRFHLSAFNSLNTLPIGVVGSVGCIFSDRLDALAKNKNFKITKYLQYPIEQLIEYHRK